MTDDSHRPFHLGRHDVPLSYQARLMADSTRLDAYERAIRQLVEPGMVVLDLGSGTGILSMLAARRGAERVHAVEAAPVAELARALVEANGLDEQIRVHRGDITGMEPVEPVDLVLSEFMGCFVIDDGMLSAVEAASAWMKPGAVFCPETIAMKLAPAAVPIADLELWRRPIYGLDFRPALESALHSSYRGQLPEAALLASGAVGWRLEPPVRPERFEAELSWEIAQEGELTALCGWFEATLTPEIVLSNGPGHTTHWGQQLFPLPPTGVEPGDRLELRLWLEERGDDARWCWRGRVTGSCGEAAFDLSSLQDLSKAQAPTGAIDRPEDWPRMRQLMEQGNQALQAGRCQEAVQLYSRVVSGLEPRDDEVARGVYENLGGALHLLGANVHARRALWRALDGEPTRSEQALRLLIRATLQSGRHLEGQRLLRLYRLHFGEHPELPQP